METTSATIPVGFKQTEIGEIPEDWKLKTFGEIFDFKSTASNSRSDLTKSDSTHYIHYGDIHTVFHRHLNLEKRETPMISQELCKNASLVRNGDWVMADASEDYSGICKAIEISGISEEKSVVAGLHTFLLRDREGVYVPGFKGHLGEAKYLHDQYVRVSVGLKVFGVTKTSLRDLLIPVPPKLEQTRIEEVLSNSVSQIQALENLIKKKRDIKQGSMQELLAGKTRLPDFDRDIVYRQTEIGEIPKDWDVKRLGDLFTITSSKRVYQSEWKSYGIPFYRTRELAIIGSNGSVSNDLFISKEMYESFKRRYGVPKIGDILVTGVGTLGRVFLVPDSREFYFKDGNIIWFKTNESINSEFLKQLYLTPLILNQIFGTSTGSTVGTYTISDAKKTLIPYPTFKEQEAIARVLTGMDAEIFALEQRLEKTKAIKQGMMQQLLTGRIRLVDSSTPQEA